MIWALPLLPAVSGAVLAAIAPRRRTLLALWAGVTLAATLGVAVAGAAGGWTGRHAWSEALSLSAALPPAAAVVAVLVPVVALPVTLYATAHEHPPGLARLIGLLLVFVGGMELVVIASDLLTLLIGWEIVGACSWALIGHRWREAEAPASGRYAFIMTRFGDLGLFLAAMAAYAGTGSFAYADLPGLEGVPLVVVAFGVLLSAAAKSGQVPFAPWLFRAMAGPTSVSALLHAATMVAAGAYILIRLGPALSAAPGFAATVLGVGLLTALAGGIVAVVQNHAKKLLAASTSAHYGLMFVAVGAGFPQVALAHLVAHAVFKALLFLAAGVAGERAGTFALHRQAVGAALPWFTLYNAVGVLALAAGPTKEAVTTAAGTLGPWLAAGVMVAGGLSAAYAARFHLLAYGRADAPPHAGPLPGGLEKASAGVLALLAVASGALWMPAVQTALGLPHGTPAELVPSLLLIGLGALAGAFLARRVPKLGTTGASAAAARWLGLATLIEAAAVRPFTHLAVWAARSDDRFLDALPRAAASASQIAAHAQAVADGRFLDALPRAFARLGHGGARALAVADSRTVDGGVRATAAFGAWLGGVGDRLGETLADGLPEGLGRLVALSGSDLRRLHGGMSHHYYAALAGGAVVLILTLGVLS